MKNTKNPHEIIYKNLKESGAAGWGADSFDRRMKGWEETLRWCLPYFPKAPARVLDVGCGAGDSALPLAKLAYDVCGFDISETAIDWAQEKFKQQNISGKFYVQDLSQQLITDYGSFDVIVDSATMHCILHPAREKAFENIRKLLSKNGIFLLSSMIGDPKELEHLESFDPVLRLQKVKGLPYRYTPMLEVLKKEIQQAGFSVQQEKIQENPWWNHYNAILVKTD